MSDEKAENTGAGNVVGFQMPVSVQKHKDKVAEMLKKHDDLDEAMVNHCFGGLSEEDLATCCEMLENGHLDEVADGVREHVLRELVRHRMKEVVRKKPGGGGYVLYAPNPGKRKGSKSVGTFPTQLGAKRAELARFPPRDPARLAKLKKSIERMMKRKPGQMKKVKESLEGIVLLRAFVRSVLVEASQQGGKGADWDGHIARLSDGALSQDRKLANLQKNIDRRTGEALENALATVAKALKKDGKVKSHGLKKGEDGSPYLSFEVQMEGATVGPIFVAVREGVPRLEVTPTAKAALTQVDPDAAKKLRGELLSVQEAVLDEVDDVRRAVAQRDAYLEKMQSGLDKVLSEMTPLQLSIVRELLVAKYRKLR